MTHDEITLLASGIAIGINLMLLLNVYWSWLDDRRDRTVVRAAQAKLRAATRTEDLDRHPDATPTAGEEAQAELRGLQLRLLGLADRVKPGVDEDGQA
ncbi:hypothetical protein ACWDWT_30805 [Streptomyces sp. NPDC003343]